MEPAFDLSGYEPPISLWELVEQYVPKHEHEELRNILGQSLIDQSLELHQEIETLLDIWRDYRDETNENTKVKLPEPPGLRERLVQELQFFVESVKEKSKNHGINPERVFQNGHNLDVLDYAMESSRPGTARPGSRPSTARSRDGRETPMISTPTGSDRASAASMLSEEIESMNDKLNFLKFDEVVQHLRSTLEEEIEILLRDIKFLYECLDEEATYRAESQGTYSREPTIAELQQERSKMEKELLSQEITKTAVTPAKTIRSMPAVPARKPGMFTSTNGTKLTNPTSPTPGSLSSGSPNSPRGAKTGQVVNSLSSPKRQEKLSIKPDIIKGGPMKASHDIISKSERSDSASISKKRTDERYGGSERSLIGVVKLGQKPPDSGTTQGILNSAKSSDISSKDKGLLPSRPTSERGQIRPSSAERFRRMVQGCRDTT